MIIMLRCYTNVGGDWEEVDGLDPPRGYPTMTALGNYILITGGWEYTSNRYEELLCKT